MAETPLKDGVEGIPTPDTPNAIPAEDPAVPFMKSTSSDPLLTGALPTPALGNTPVADPPAAIDPPAPIATPPVADPLPPTSPIPTPAQASPIAAEDPVTPDPPLDGSKSPTEINLVSNPEYEDPGAFGRATEGGGTPPPSSEVPPFVEAPYNPDESRDATRQTITLWLIGLLCVIVALTFVALFARGASSGFGGATFFQELKSVLDVLVGPIITLLASAIGFYFGYKQGEGNQGTTNGGKKP